MGQGVKVVGFCAKGQKLKHRKMHKRKRSKDTQNKKTAGKFRRLFFARKAGRDAPE